MMKLVVSNLSRQAAAGIFLLFALPVAAQLIDQPLPNGDFADGLNHWEINISPALANPPGSIEVVNGAAEIRKGGSYLAELSQGFVAPEGLAALRFRIVEGPYFSGTSSFIPDTFEAHLVRPGGTSAVAVWRAGSSSNFNTGPMDLPQMGGATSFDGETVRMELDGIGSGVPLAIVFTFAGPRSFHGGWVAIDDVVLEVAPGPALLSVDPEQLDFGDIWPGATRTMSFEVFNAAPENATDLILSTIGIVGDSAFEITGGDCEVGVVIAAGGVDRCQVEVTFSPGSIASFQGFVTLAGKDQQQVVELSGDGYLPDDRLFSDRFESTDD
jgi:hypothetical protein